MHEAVDGDGDSIGGEGSQHTDEVSLVESSPSSLLELVAEALHHRLVFEVGQIVRLHQGLDVIEGVVEDPI